MIAFTAASCDPPRGGGLKTKIDQHCHLATLNVFDKNSRAKQDLKDGWRCASKPSSTTSVWRKSPS
jgi:hypothetical protein